MTSTQKKLAIAAVASLAATYYWKQNQDKKKRQMMKRKNEDGTQKEKKVKKNPMMQVFWLLWPFGKSAMEVSEDPEAAVGRWELVAIFAVSILRTWHQNRMVYVKTNLMLATYRRDASMFKKIIRETIVLSVLSSVIFATHRYLKERLTLVWREKLTRQLHRKYFHAMNYYKLSHLNKSRIPDVEERITRDPRRFCKGLADEMEKLSAATTSGVWFTYKLMTISSLPYAVSPLGYFYLAFRASMLIAPNWSKMWRGMLDLRGIYFKSQSRLQIHSEAICAYQGNEQEKTIIQQKWTDFRSYCSKFVHDASLFQFVAAAFFEYGGHSFGEALVVGKFISGEHPLKAALKAATNPHEKVAAIGELFSEMRFLTEYFIRAMSSQGTIIAVLRQLQNMRGPAKRLTELYDTLDNFEQDRIESTTFKNDPNRIKFENVQVYTPLGHLLVKDLNFEIEAGTSLLLTGCNGSGKSSIFRCLGSLWHVPAPGVITKPGGNEPGLNKLVFYLPQKPYNVLGTLRDQLCYPEEHENAAGISKKELLNLLEEVDLGYLIDRDTDEERNWENELSLGEKQRLAMARLLYFNPKYAILDECTSGVSASMEKKLYEICRKRGISCITISHRPVLEQYHDVVLNILADGKGGWSLRKTDTAEDLSGAKAVGGYSKSYLEQGDALVERQRLKDRSAKYVKLAEEQKNKEIAAGTSKLGESTFNKTTTERVKDILNQFLPNGADLSDPEFRRVLQMAGIIVLKTLLADGIARYDGYILSTALMDDWGVFTRAMILGSFFRTFLAGFDALLFWQKWNLNLNWRQRLTEYMMKLYFTGNTFYDIKNHDERIPDPEERITEQVEQLSISLTELWTSLMKPAFDIGFNTVMLYRLLGAKGVGYTSGYMLFGMFLMRYAVPNFRQIQKVGFDLEGRFRFVHTRLIEHTESIAFFGGGEVEHHVANTRFDAIKKHFEEAQIQTLRFNIFNNFTIKQTPDIIAFALRMLFAEGYIDDSQILTNKGGSDLSSKGEYIQQTVMRSFKSYGDAFDLQETIGNFIGTVDNVTDLMYTLEDLSKKNNTSNKIISLKDSKDIGFDGIKFSNVDIVAPGNMCVASNLNLEIKPHSSLVVTGPNASGKSSLFRVIGGLWQVPTGKIYRPCSSSNKVTINDVFLVPQKPYSVTGSLSDQLSYPNKAKNADGKQEELEDLLDLVGIKYLLDRYNLWDTIMKWEDVLSLGEQQRLNCARLFYHNPKFAILDECTSAVSSDVEEKLYRTAKERGITSITISQRLALEEFHENELKMGDANGIDGWRLVSLHEPSVANGKAVETKEEENEVEVNKIKKDVTKEIKKTEEEAAKTKKEEVKEVKVPVKEEAKKQDPKKQNKITQEDAPKKEEETSGENKGEEIKQVIEEPSNESTQIEEPSENSKQTSNETTSQASTGTNKKKKRNRKKKK